MILFWVILGLSLAWIVLWYRSRMLARRARGVSARQLLVANDLEARAFDAEQEGHPLKAQSLRLQSTWLRVKPDAGDSGPPTRLDPTDTDHLMFADVIRQRYAKALADRDSPYGGCTVKPTSLLPFPKEAVSSALVLFSDLARGVRTSPHVSRNSISERELEVVERSRQLLAAYIDRDPSDIPTDPEENMEFARRELDRNE